MPTVLKPLLFAALLLAAGASVWVWLSRNSTNDPQEKSVAAGSFLDVLKNPDLALESELGPTVGEEIDATFESADGDPKRIAQLLDDFVFDSDGMDMVQSGVLRDLGAQLEPRTLELLTDTRYREKLLTPTGGGFASIAPFHRVSGLFLTSDFLASDEVLVAFRAFAEKTSIEDEDEIVGSVAGVIGRSGNAGWIPEMLQMLENDEICDELLNGLSHRRPNEFEEEVRDSLFPQVASLWPDRDHLENVAQALLAMDPVRGKKRLEQDDVFTSDFAQLAKVLRTTRRTSIIYSRESLIQLIQQLDEMPEPSRRQLRALDYAIQNLAKHANPDDLLLFQKFTDHTNSRVSEVAVAAIHTLTGTDGSNFPERELHRAVCNGGFEGYFFNTYADRWPEALEALDEIGAPQRAAIFRSALSKINSGQPSTDNSERRRQLAELIRSNEQALRDDGLAWCKLEDENLDALRLKQQQQSED